MNKRVLFMVITILFTIVLSFFVKNYNIRNVQNEETERIDNIEKNETFPYDEENNYLYEEPDTESNDDLKYEFIQLKMV